MDIKDLNNLPDKESVNASGREFEDDEEKEKDFEEDDVDNDEGNGEEDGDTSDSDDDSEEDNEDDQEDDNSDSDDSHNRNDGKGYKNLNTVTEILKEEDENLDKLKEGIEEFANPVNDVIKDKFKGIKGKQAKVNDLLGMVKSKLKSPLGLAAKIGLSTKAMAYSMVLGGLKLLQSVTSLAVGVFTAVKAFFVSIITFIATHLSISIAFSIALVVSGVIAATVVAVGFLVGAGISPEAEVKEDPCIEQIQKLGESFSDVNISQLKNAENINSILNLAGFTNMQIAAILGNMQAESGIDPYRIEGTLSLINNFNGNVDKWKENERVALFFKDKNAYTEKLIKEYQEQGISLNVPQYGPEGNKVAGLGLIQFTSGNKIIKEAEKLNKNWFDLDTQMAIIIAKGSSITTGYCGRRK